MPSINDSFINERGKRDEPVLEQRERPTSGMAGFPAEPVYPTYSRFLATPLPLIATYQPDALRQFYRGGVPQQRIFPVRNG